MSSSQVLHTIAELLDGFQVKSAASGSESAAGVSTSHPIGSVEDNVSTGTTGAHAAENSAGVKSLVGDASAEAPGEAPSQAAVSTKATVQAKATGEDPEAETPAKCKKDDENSPAGMPAPTKSAQQFLTLAKQAEEQGAALLAGLTVAMQAMNAQPAAAKRASVSNEVPATTLTPATPEVITAPDPVKAKSDEDENGQAEAMKAAQAGYDLAGLFAGYDVTPDEVQNASCMVVDRAAAIIKTASDNADLVIEYVKARQAGAKVAGQLDKPVSTRPPVKSANSGEASEKEDDEGSEGAEDAGSEIGGGGPGDSSGSAIMPEAGAGAMSGDQLGMLLGGDAGAAAGGPGAPGAGQSLSPEDLQILIQLLEQLAASGAIPQAKAAELRVKVAEHQKSHVLQQRKSALEKALLELTSKK